MPDHSNTTEPEIAATKNQKKAKIEYSKWKRVILSHVTLVRIFIALLFLGLLYVTGFLAIKGAQALNVPVYFNALNNFITIPVGQLASYNGRTNILVMGKAGGVHDGPDLTDTMMLVSVSLGNHDVKIISVPRDTWIPEIRAKINSAYYWGNQKNPGGGIVFAKAITTEVVGVPIQYGAVIDFSGFKDVIDELGGIQVNVENSFIDYRYPIAGRENDTCNGDRQFSCRYETLHFVQGKQLMDGETALKFVRSRHAEGIEGTDIAREVRQGKVIDAIKNKLLDKKTYLNLGRDIAILKVVLRSIQTDIDYPTAAILARLIYDGRNSVNSFLIPQEFLINPPISLKYDMQSVFIPKAGSGKWDEINKWVAGILR
jgi:polyisoprenyl-teichoic acid--peptidoglycan teichoic acid transferase